MKGEHQADGKHDKRRDPHAFRTNGRFAHRFLANHTHHIIKYKETDRGYQGEADATLADYGTERGTNKEKQQAGDGKGEFSYAGFLHPNQKP